MPPKSNILLHTSHCFLDKLLKINHDYLNANSLHFHRSGIYELHSHLQNGVYSSNAQHIRTCHYTNRRNVLQRQCILQSFLNIRHLYKCILLIQVPEEEQRQIQQFQHKCCSSGLIAEV